MSIRPRRTPVPTGPPRPTFLQRVVRLVTGIPIAPPSLDWNIPIESDPSDIPIENDSSSSPSSQSGTPADGWKDAFEKLKTLDELMQKDYKEDIDTLLVFAGLFSAVLTTFIVATFDSLQQDYSQVAANALYHISQQLRDPSVVSLPTQIPEFRPQSSDVRVNILWLVSLVASLLAALLSILVKQWLGEYLTWTSMVPGKNTVALRQYRAQGWDRWGVRRYREAIPMLLQLALVLFLCGLVDLMWNLQPSVAIVVTAVAGITVGIWLYVTFMPFVVPQCPYRSPLSWVSKRIMQALSWGLNACLATCVVFPISLIFSIILMILVCFGICFQPIMDFAELCSDFASTTLDAVSKWAFEANAIGRVSWNYWDLRRMNDPSVAHSFALKAIGEVLASFPLTTILSTMSTGAFEADGDAGGDWLPITTFWSLLGDVLGYVKLPQLLYLEDKLMVREAIDSASGLLSRLSLVAVSSLIESMIREDFPAPDIPSEDFSRAVVRLVRPAVRTQKACLRSGLYDVRYALNVSHILAETEDSVLPYHTTTLVWLLHDLAPEALVHAAEKHLRSLSDEDWIANAAKWKWNVSEIITYLNAVSTLLRQSRVTAAKADIAMVALHLTRLHLTAIEQDESAFLAVKDVFASMTVLLQRSAELPIDHREYLPLRQDWCTVLAEMMPVPSSARPQESVVPPDLAFVVVKRLGLELSQEDESWHTRGVLSPSDGSRLSTVVITRLAQRFGGAGNPSTVAAAADPGTHMEPPAPVTGESLV